ncbi:hypothetical protein CA12_13480 [Alienimonas californiensis]|uniref:Uncharacterized protein n=2 Tax=Alienimonas californiensis TaxID=2527989 RepID=A0A517P7E6_9PLAN|nr:hypothetical protein CA12_13480 [Alienimonas californiensis]
MIGLAGRPDSAGTGAEGAVKGARVVVSAAELNRSVADVYAVRKDDFDAHRDQCEALVAGWLAGRERVVKLRNDFEAGNGRMSPEYRKLLESAQGVFGKDVMPNLEVDAHGLLLDCQFANLPGQIEFFRTEGNLVGFDAKLVENLIAGGAFDAPQAPAAGGDAEGAEPLRRPGRGGQTGDRRIP